MPAKNSEENSGGGTSQVELDLYFLIARFLSQGPCQEAGRTLVRELEKCGLLHKSLDWTGNVQDAIFQHSLSRFRDIAPNHLLQICEKMGPLLNNALPPPMLAESLLCGLGRHSLLRNQNTVVKTTWGPRTFSACIARNPVVPPQNFVPSHNWAHGIFGRELGGSKFKNLLRPIKTLYGQMKLHRRILGHLSSVYCILFDRTGMRIFTGSDDCLIKCWSSSQGRLLATFRGHQSEICDMDISYENTLLASASCDKEIRIWDTRNGKPITILQSHSAMITSIEFSAIVQGDTRYLISTGRDGNVCFWIWNVQTLEFESRPYKFEERNRPGVAMLCSSCSAGGRFVAVGGSDNLVHIYHIPFEHNTTTIGPLTIAEQDEHTNTVDSIWFSRDGVRLISGSKDGTARIWTFEYSTWSSAVLDVTRTTESVEDFTNAENYKTRSKTQGKENINKLCVIMVAWDCCDENVITSLTDFTIKVWNSRTRRLVSTLRGHTDEAYCLEPHPDDKRVLLTSGHDGNVFLWDVLNGTILMNFHNMLEGLGHGAVFDAKFSRDGNLFACSDSHGHILVFGYGDGKAYLKCPVQQFFHTDYRPLIRDQHGYVLDEQTQQAPHLMPPPFLVDVDGNPYLPELQRLVPGREHSNDSQLLPNLVMQENDAFQVIDVENIPEEAPAEPQPHPRRSVLDDRIQQLLHEGDVSDEELEPSEGQAPFASPSSAVGLRREGDTVGVRQMHRNAPRSQVASVADIMALTQRVITPQFSPEERERKDHIRRRRGQFELSWYRRERKKKRPVSYRRLSKDTTKQSPKEQGSHRNQRRLRSNIRFKEDPEEEEEEPDDNHRRRRWIHRIRRNDHGYSTRSSAPRRRISSAADSNQADLDNIALDVGEDESILSGSGETSAYSSSDEDFSRSAKILRRSKRGKHATNRIRHRKEEDREVRGLRRSGRHRRVPSRLKNSSNSDSDAVPSEDNPDEPSSSSSLFVSPVGTRSRKQDRQKDIRRARARAKRITSNISNNCDSSEEEQNVGSVSDDLPSTSRNHAEVTLVRVQLNGVTTSDQNKKVTKTETKNTPDGIVNQTHLPFNIPPGQPPPENFLPPEWIKRVTPCNFPYMPQIEDEVVYLRQGHESYISKVLAEHAWTVDDSNLCYKNFPDIGIAEPCRVTQIKYHVGPPVLCEVLLMPINRKISKNSTGFSVKYHDMPNVVDFLILKDKYDLSVSRQWSDGDRFRSVIDDTWWYGTIVERKPHNSAFPQSHFQSYAIVWDSDSGQDDVDYLSPWDMEPVPEHYSNPVVTRSQNYANSFATNVNHVRLDMNEIRQLISYKYKRADWTDRDMSDSDDEDAESKMNRECDRIADGIEKLIDDGEFFAFASAVDITQYPLYPLYVPYPTDLSTMLQRVKNRFYRRSSAICWEFSQLEANAISFNEPNSVITKKAKQLCELFEKFVKSKTCSDILELQHEEEDEASSYGSEEEDAVLSEVDTRSRPILSSEDESEDAGKSSQDSQDVSEYATTAGEEEDVDGSWVEEAKVFLSDVVALRDSRPFRERPRRDDEDEEEESRSVDLTTIVNNLENRLYKSPLDLKNDIEKMFSSFKNSDLTREVKSMYLRLGPHMRSRIDKILEKWQKTKLAKSDARSLRRARRSATLAVDTISTPSPKCSQDSDWIIEPRTRNQRHHSTTAIGAYPTRQMLKRQRKMAKAESRVSQPTRSTRSSNRKEVESGISKIEEEIEVKEEVQSPPSSGNKPNGEVVESRMLEDSIDDDENSSRVREKRSKRRHLSDTEEEEAEIGQGDAGMNMNSRLRKKPKLTALAHDSSSGDGEDEFIDSASDFEDEGFSKKEKKSKSNGHVRKYARPPTFSKKNHGHQLRANRQKPVRLDDYSDYESESDDIVRRSHKNRSMRKSSRAERNADTRKRVTYNEEDSDSDAYGDIVETDDLECEFPPLSPEGHPMPKKSKRFRDANGWGEDSYTQHATNTSELSIKIEKRTRSSSSVSNENADSR